MTLLVMTALASCAWLLAPAAPSRASLPALTRPGSQGHGEAFVPAYGAGYSQDSDLLRQILEELRAMRAELRGLGAGAKPVDGAQLLVSRCAACHQDGAADDRGGTFVLVEKDGALAELSLAERRRVTRLVAQGKMPPAGPLPEAERRLITEFLGQPVAPTKEPKK